MLAFVRRSATKWVAAVILFLVLVAIVVTGFGTGGFGSIGNLGGAGPNAGDQLATVDGTQINATEINDLVNRAYQRAREQQPTLDMETFLSQGVFNQTLNQMIVAAAIRNYGEERGLVTSQRMVDREIANIPAFRNFAGQFDQGTFRQMLASQNLTEGRLRDDIARTLMQRQLLGPVALGVRVPEGVARQYAALLLERRRGMVAAVPAALLAQGINPTEAQIGQFYQANRAAFTQPERRVIKYAVIGPEQVAGTAAATATEAEIARVYQNSQATYGARETRTLQSIVLPTQAAAQAFAQRVRGGTAFVDAAGQAGFAAGDVTFTDQQRAQFQGVTNAEVAGAAFGAAQGAVVGPIRSELGFHVVRVERINTRPARPLETVRADIARAIEQRKRDAALGATINRVQEQVDDGASFEEVARGAGLTIVTTPPVTAAGQPPAGVAWPVPAELQPLLRGAFDMDPEELEPVVEEIQANARYALVAVDRVQPAAPPPLAQIRDQVRNALIQRTALRRSRELADQIARRINAGTPAARAFAEAQPRIAAPRAVDLRRLDISRQGQEVPAALIALFSIPRGHAQVLPTPGSPGWFIVVHEQNTAGDIATMPQLVTTTRTEFTQAASEELAQQFARAIEVRAQIQRNGEAIRRASNRSGAGGAPAEGN